MFLSRLDEKQQGIFLYYCEKLISADGKVDAREEELLASFRAQMASSITPHSSSDLSADFPTSASKAAFMLELLGLAYADEKYHSRERDFVLTVADKVGINQELLADMEAWVVRQLSLAREAEEFMRD
ncbi:hypothetical protein [Aromatoleum evansii]|uniref:hypothetical protein n=1 Tax=Aromatoleum evansii TaxID=59406 RepID=UPI00145D6C44|nr:hypothetical protein [Aromatoleum evansii]NMG31096.1 hypothetical protein [Aromatoleum evansii]